jgi:hypothetical protein
MTDLISGLAFVISLTALLATLVVAREVGELRGRAPHSQTTAMPPVDIVGYQALDGRIGTLPGATPRIVLFAQTQCGPCASIVRELAEASNGLRAAVLLIVTGSDAQAQTHAESARIALEQVVADPAGAIARRFAAVASPSAAIVSRLPLPSANPVASIGDLERLAEQLISVPPGPTSRDAKAVAGQ